MLVVVVAVVVCVMLLGPSLGRNFFLMKLKNKTKKGGIIIIFVCFLKREKIEGKIERPGKINNSFTLWWSLVVCRKIGTDVVRSISYSAHIVRYVCAPLCTPHVRLMIASLRFLCVFSFLILSYLLSFLASFFLDNILCIDGREIIPVNDVIGDGSPVDGMSIGHDVNPEWREKFQEPNEATTTTA